MAFGDEDIPVLLADFGSDIQLGTTTVKGIVDQNEQVILESFGQVTGVTAKSILVTIKTGSLSGLAVGSSIKIDNVTHNVRARRQVEDGALTHLLCEKP